MNETYLIIPSSKIPEHAAKIMPRGRVWGDHTIVSVDPASATIPVNWRNPFITVDGEQVKEFKGQGLKTEASLKMALKNPNIILELDQEDILAILPVDATLP
jgi:hypothetical protein